MAQRHDIVTINFQANARGANAALESLRSECDRCNSKVEQLKKQLKGEIQANIPADKIEKTRQDLAAATKEARQFNNAFKELSKGMATLDKGIKAFNDGTLNQMSAAFQKAVFNAAKLTRLKLDPLSETYKRDKAELTALMDASQQYYARLQADSAQVIKTIKEGGKVSRQAINDELTAHRELLQVLAENDAGYQRTIRNIAILEQRQREMGGNYAYIRQNIKDTQKVSDETLRSMYAELEKTNQEGKVTQDIIRQNAAAMREIRAEQGRRVQNVLGGDLTKQSEGSIRSAIANAKELIQIYGSTSKKAQELAAQIVNAEEHLKTTGVEGERAARKQAEAVKLLADKHKMMQDRVKNLSSLSTSALAETQKYWQAQMDGAEKASTAYRKAEKNLKAINAEMQRQATAQLQASAGKLSRKNLATLSEQELQTSIAAAKQLAASMKPTDAAYKQLVDDIVRAEEHVKQFGLEGQRSARQAADQMKVMEDRMKNVKALSNSALEETRRFWQAQMDGAQRGSTAYKQAETNLKQLTAEQQRLVNEQNKTMGKQLLSRGNLSTMSEVGIRQAIEAAKQYQQTLSTTDPMYKRLTKAIVDAEEHIKKYGLEAERAARKEVEAAKKAADERKKTDKLMSDQLKQGKALSESALKAQQQYWQRLIDDPKTAASSLKHYEAELKKVKQLQDQMVQTQGKNALAFFRGDTSNASASQIQEQAKALKAYRDSLPQKANATLIKEIDDLLAKAGQTAKKAAEQTMSLRDAYKVGLQGLSGSFKGTPEQLKQAKKALEETLAVTEKGTKRYEQLRRAINGVELEEKRLGSITKEVQAVLDQPKGKSFNALKQAVEQGRQALNNMDRSTKEGQKQFDELAKKIKAADYEMKQLAGTAKGSATAFEKAWSRLKTYVTLYMGAAVAIQKITAMFGDIMELSDRMGEVRKTTGFTADEVGRLSENLKKMDVRTPLEDLVAISASAGQLGLKTLEDVQGFTEAANKLMIALPEMGKEAATEMMRVAIATGEVEKIRKELQEGTIEGSSATAVAMEKIASTIDRLRASSASTAPEITDFVKRVGAVGAQSGITIDQVSALGSTISSLGMRIEMSATALSRMIPAIKNNAFNIAHAIGVTPDTIRNLFETGRGMEVILMILQRMKDANMDEDSIEAMMGMGGMRDIMKDLNQQGARAGIVFAGLSQNVDELRRQLGVASEAYEENIAIQNEYNKMNETTAAKWERLKNTIEELFVGDEAQRYLGGIIDGLRYVIDLITGPLRGAFNATLTSFSVYFLGIGGMIWKGIINPIRLAITEVHSLKTQTIGMAATWRRAWRSMDAASKANLIFAIASAVFMLGKALYESMTRVSGLNKALADMEDNLMATTREVGELFHKYTQIDKKQNDLVGSAKRLKDREGELSKQVEELRKKLGEGAEKSDEFKKKQEELEEAHKKVATAEGEAADATNRRSAVISEINSKYSTYLGYMLSEASTAETVASAHDLIIAALKEEMYWKEKNDAFRTVRDMHQEDLKSYRESALGEMKGIDPMRQQNIMAAWASELSNIPYDASKGGFQISGQAYATVDQAMEAMKSKFNSVLITNGGYYMVHTDDQQSRLNDWWGESGFGGFTDRGFKDWTREMLEVAQETATLQNMSGSSATKAHEQTVQRARDNMNALIAQATPSGGRGTNKQIAEAIVGIEKNLSKYGELIGNYRQFIKNNYGIDNADTSLKGIANVLLKDLPADTRKAVEEEMQRVAANGINPPKPTTPTNPWGNKQPAESTAYTEMNAEQLVERRKQMKNFVNAIQTDSDVKAVLAEDKALQKAIEKGMSSDMRTVIEWYNTERLKIQDELHARHLTNTGDWMDPKKQKGAHKQFQNEMQAYLDEIDAYYTERKAKIQEAQNDEQISEAEAKNRTLANDAEWRQRRAELQQLYAEKSAKVTQAEQDAIYNIISERTGDSEAFVKAMIQKTIGFAKQIEASGEKGAAVVHKWRSKLDKDTEQDFLRQRNAIGQHMKDITAIVNNENPYAGITEELRKNLGTMDALLTDIKDKEKRTVDKEIERTMFILEQSTKGYSLTWEELMGEMAKRGWQAWADAIEGDPQTQQRLMHQVYRVFEKVQDAIKKEASELKKQADIMWSNILLPGGDGKTTIKDAFEQTIGALGIQEGRVSRSNSLIGAGQASERVADKLAIQQMKVQLAMQRYQYDLVRKIGKEKIDTLRKEAEADEARGKAEDARAKRMQADNAEQALNLATRKEQTEELKMQEQIIARTEESQARLYKELREWGDLLASSLQSVFEASNAGNAEYYNELAKLNLTGKGGPGAGTYIVTNNAGTSDATAHYEYLDERQALERQREIEQQNAQAEAWKKVMDDINMKLSETITDQLNAMLQNQAIDANTDATMANTAALYVLASALGGQTSGESITRNAEGFAVDESGQVITPIQPTEQKTEGGAPASLWPMSEEHKEQIAGWNNELWQRYGETGVETMQTMADATAEMPSVVTEPFIKSQEQAELITENTTAASQAAADAKIAASDRAAQAELANQQKVKQGEKDTEKQMASGAQTTFAKMTAAANLYGIAYQAMSNDNLSAAQKFELIALQAAGNAAIAGVQAALSKSTGETVAEMPKIAAKSFSINPIAGAAIFAVISAVLGGLMGVAASKVAKSKQEIAQATGASMGAGRLATGMLTYAEGNVNEMTDPSTLTQGRHYNVDGADGKTYRAKYTGTDAKTHITTGPEFHLVGEKGREAIIDAHTTRNIQMNDPEIWHTIQTLYNGGSMSRIRSRRGRGVRAFADGNLDDFEEISSEMGTGDMAENGFGGEQIAAFQSSIDRNNELLERALTEGIHAKFDVYGKGGLVDSYDTGKKNVTRHGERY